jgi:hypothetical protein
MAVSAGGVIFSPTLARVRTFRGQEKLALVAAKVNCVVSLDVSSLDGSRRSASWSLDAVSGRAIRSALALGGFLPVVTHFALNKHDLSDSFRP